MGLGKTIQTISFLASLYEESKICPFLVLVPLSTASNWEREFAKWAPQLYTVTLTGNMTSREIIKKYELFPGNRKSQLGIQAHVIITSYEMLMMEKSALTQFTWEAIVVDEGQRLKNQDSKLFRELNDFKSIFRVLLTGTPLQNSLKELFTLMHFLDSEKVFFPSSSLVPSFVLFYISESFFLLVFQFADPKALEEEFASLVDKNKVENLHNQLRPHLLRRIKEEVLKDLPKKVEVIVPVQMSALQKEVRSRAQQTLIFLRTLLIILGSIHFYVVVQGCAIEELRNFERGCQAKQQNLAAKRNDGAQEVLEPSLLAPKH